MVTMSTEYRLQCTETDKVWARVYDTEKAVICAQGQWNSQVPATPGTLKAARGENIGSTHPAVRAVEVNVEVVKVVREPKGS